MDDRLLAVVTYPRSGTHWFCSLAYRWFYSDRTDLMVMMRHHENLKFVSFGADDGERAATPWGKLFAGHILDPMSETAQELRRTRRLVYLMRDGIDVLFSRWRMVRARDGYTGSLLEFMRDTLQTSNPGNPLPRPMNPAESWWWSTERWQSSGDPIFHYEDLILDASSVRDRLGRILGLAAKEAVDPGRPVGYGPSEMPGVGKGIAAFGPAEYSVWLKARQAVVGGP